ncbi:MAG: Sulfatase-like hydrolase/transferase [Acidobacteriota bacterium]|nr:Sulfatase-like hydrolase/transferase [Acidobacteriota bacterium]
MSTMRLLGAAALAALIIAPLSLYHGCKKKNAEPNVVLIVIDTLRADHLPIYGYEKNTAPFLSELASRGVVFENTFSPSSWTGPATASIFTSLYPFQHGVTTGFFAGKFFNVEINRIPGSIETLPELLKKDGYKTYGVANNPNICDEEGFTQGFDKFMLFKDAHENKMTLQLESWSSEIKAQKKYFLYIHYNDCHVPYRPRKPWYEKKEEKREDIIARYDSEISYVDEKIKKMYERFGWDKNTLLIIVADHGEEFWEHNRTGHGKNLYGEVIRVPMLFYFPGEDNAKKRIKINASNMDILPTVRNYLGIKNTQVEEGIDLLPLVYGEGNNTQAGDRYIFSHLLKHNREQDGPLGYHKATIYQDWKYIFVDKFQKEYRRELFNMKEDPREKNNVYKTNLPMANMLFARFTEFEKKCKKFPQETQKIELDKKKMEELKTLGYVR